MTTKPEWQIRGMEITLQHLRYDNERLKGEYAFCEEAARRLDVENKRLREMLEQIDRIATNTHISEGSAVRQIHTLIASRRRIEAIPCEGECGNPLHVSPT